MPRSHSLYGEQRAPVRGYTVTETKKFGQNKETPVTRQAWLSEEAEIQGSIDL